MSSEEDYAETRSRRRSTMKALEIIAIIIAIVLMVEIVGYERQICTALTGQATSDVGTAIVDISNRIKEYSNETNSDIH